MPKPANIKKSGEIDITAHEEVRAERMSEKTERTERTERTDKAQSEIEADIAETVRAKSTMKQEGRKVKKNRDKNKSRSKYSNSRPNPEDAVGSTVQNTITHQTMHGTVEHKTVPPTNFERSKL